MSEVVIYEKVRSCPYCGAFKKKDGWNYAKQTCDCGFGKIPTPEEIEADDYSTAQVQNMSTELFSLQQQLAECRAELITAHGETQTALEREFKERDARKGLELELTHRYEQLAELEKKVDKYMRFNLHCIALTGTLWPQNETTEKLAELIAALGGEDG